MKYLLPLIVFLAAACSSQEKISTQPNLLTPPAPSIFEIPAMQLTPVSNEVELDILTARKNKLLYITYTGKIFPSLYNVVFSAQYNQGFVNVTKKVNGLSLSKLLINTSLAITNFAVDKENEIYIITSDNKVFKFAP